jgi:hypothetical protein
MNFIRKGFRRAANGDQSQPLRRLLARVRSCWRGNNVTQISAGQRLTRRVFLVAGTATGGNRIVVVDITLAP